MKLNRQKAKLLNQIGVHPEYSKEKLSEVTGINKRRMSELIYKFRENTLIVKAPLYDESYEWELLQKGRKLLHEYYKQIEEDFGIRILLPYHHVFKPKYARKKNETKEST